MFDVKSVTIKQLWRQSCDVYFTLGMSFQYTLKQEPTLDQYGQRPMPANVLYVSTSQISPTFIIARVPRINNTGTHDHNI